MVIAIKSSLLRVTALDFPSGSCLSSCQFAHNELGGERRALQIRGEKKEKKRSFIEIRQADNQTIG